MPVSVLAFLLAGAFQGPGSTVVLNECLAIGSVGRGGRIPFPTDRLTQLVVNGQFSPPREGDSLGEQKWATVKANKDGNFEGRMFQGGYAYFNVDWPRDETVLVNAAGAGMFYANGEPRGGDVYAYGYLQIPVRLHKGSNSLLAAPGRGQLKITVKRPLAPVTFNIDDLTLPDLVAGEDQEQLGGVILENCTGAPATGYTLKCEMNGQSKTVGVPLLPTDAGRKVAFTLPKTTPPKADQVSVLLTLLHGNTEVDHASFTVRVRKPEQTRKVTFVSQIDGSVQYFAVNPPAHPKPGLAMILSTHGASVEAIGQADAYSSKDWAYVVCPTNRRPYGFDWEDWGRMDAMEVLALARKMYKTNDEHTYETGHSMGGHGAWQLGMWFPNIFAAIAPSAGWRSFYTYAGKPRIANPTPMEAMFERASSGSDTEAGAENYRSEQVFILHGDADDNVPVTEARAMRDLFAKMGKPIGYHEQPGAGHWWDGPAAPGADCLEWPELIQVFQKNELKRWIGDELNFRTVNPAISSRMDSFEIRQQEHKQLPSTISAKGGAKGIAVTTSNVKALRLGLGVTSLDGKPLPQVLTRAAFADFEKVGDSWKWARRAPSLQTGPFKEAFQRRMVFVYGTNGNTEENQWAWNKARFDSEQWLCRGNGAVDIVSDREFKIADAKKRNVILYGNATTNLAWVPLLNKAPLHLERGKATVDGHTVTDSVGCLFAVANGDGMVAGIGGTTAAGMRATDRLPLWSAGVAYPDWTLFRPTTYTDGAKGVVGAGFWGESGVW